MNKVLVIVAGPTASGKTQLAIDIALHYHTEIISADSRQCYKELSIGTAKPDQAELNSVKHHFINSHSIAEPFNAGTFGIEATATLEEIFVNNEVAVMAGGSGLYIDAVLYGLDEFPDISIDLRTRLNNIYTSSGIEKLRNLLKEADPETYSTIDVSNHRRIIRALEVTLATGKPYSEFLGNKKNKQKYQTVFCSIDWPRETLYNRINERVDTMISQGLEEEAKNVIGYKNMNALRTVGYKEMFEYLEGNLNFEEAVELIKKNTRNYAKRQLTWFRKYEHMIYLQPNELAVVFPEIEIKMLHQ